MAGPGRAWHGKRRHALAGLGPQALRSWSAPGNQGLLILPPCPHPSHHPCSRHQRHPVRPPGRPGKLRLHHLPCWLLVDDRNQLQALPPGHLLERRSVALPRPGSGR